MQEEEDQLPQEVLIQSVLTWTRWWCLTSKVLVLVFKKKAWGVIGGFLKQENPLHRIDLRITLLRSIWARRGRELEAIKLRGKA